MNIGYACLTLGVPRADFKSCILKNADDKRLMELIAHNLNSLENIIDYNIRNRIKLFRISSDLIPFGSSPVNRLPWWDLFETQLSIIGEKLKEGQLRVSMHPGQYTVLNSPDESIVQRAVEDLAYHARVLDSLCTNTENKIILHVGGVYGDKDQALRRFEENYAKLDPAVKRRLVIENDDKAYTIEDVLYLGQKLGIPVVYDNLHNRINPPGKAETNDPEDSASTADSDWIDKASGTWGKYDGRQKIHYSQQDPGKRPGSHSAMIFTDEFLDFYNEINEKDIDMMLEVKDKNLSAVKCMNLISETKEIKALELEWSRYKYLILERSPVSYEAIRALLKEKSTYPATVFYWMLEDAMKIQPETGNAINAAQHVWGYFRDFASDQERRSFLKQIEEARRGSFDARKLKSLLWKLTEKYQEPYLLNSYYFKMD